MLAPDGALETIELDVAAAVEAAGADLPPRPGSEVDAPVTQEREVERARPTGSGGAPPCGYRRANSGHVHTHPFSLSAVRMSATCANYVALLLLRLSTESRTLHIP